MFGRMRQTFAFVDWRKKLCIGNGLVGILVLAGFFLLNCHSACYGNQDADKYGIELPSLDDSFI